MGKTIFLRWLIARYCIPAPHNIPVARLDFDFLPSLATIEKHPWLLLQPLAVQLNEQLAGFERLALGPTGLCEFAPLLRVAKSKEQLLRVAKSKGQQAEEDIALNLLETSGAVWLTKTYSLSEGRLWYSTNFCPRSRPCVDGESASTIT